jgi:uncharacterized protein with GYD domain
MPTYIIGAKLTGSGPRDNESFRQHVEAAARVRQQHGGRLIGAWVTFGRYDMVIVTEFPSQQAALAAVETNLAKGLFTYEVAEAVALGDFLNLAE